MASTGCGQGLSEPGHPDGWRSMPGRRVFSLRCRFVQWGLVLLLGTAIVPNPEAAADVLPWAAWGNVERFSGTAFLTHNEWVREESETTQEEHSTMVRFVLVADRDLNQPASLVWRAESADLSGTISSNAVVRFSGGVGEDTTSIDGSYREQPANIKALHLTLNTTTGRWQLLTPGKTRNPYPYELHYEGRHRDSMQRWQEESSTESQTSNTAISGVFDGVAPEKVSALRAEIAQSQTIDGKSTRGSSLNGWLELRPEYADLELVVRIEGAQLSGEQVSYADWLPEGIGIPNDDPKAGSWLRLNARLQQADGRPAQTGIRQMRFELRNTSHEPSVTMNWPPLAYPGDGKGRIPPDRQPDLRFDKQFGPVEETKKLQTQRVLPGQDTDGAPNAITRIESFDYGGWSDLAVVAELEDGREITGHLDGKPDTWLIPLPKRSAGSLIADAWRERHKVSAGDADDSEKEPEGEPGCQGDGLTLYEEYRGFMAGGHHLRSDPHKKDFMIYNACGGVASRGIALFQRLTGLAVHPQLREDERNYDMPEEKSFDFDANQHTAINGYFDQGPHRVTQHRVDIASCGHTWKPGGATFVQTHELHTRPALVDRITVERPDSSYWSQQYGVSAADKPRQFDVAVAHELLHSVGVDHHGEDDYVLHITAKPADPQTGRPAGWYDWDGTGTTPYHFIEEATGRDVSEAWAQQAALEVGKPSLVENPAPGFHTGEEFNELVQLLWVGRQEGEHSGDKSCIMRYWFSDIYPKPGAKQTFYLVPDGTEPVGSQICDQRDDNLVYPVGGSGRPRYGATHSTRGRCRHWICINDAVRPQAAVIPWTRVE